MKKALMLFILLTVTVSGFSQKVTYKDLIGGVWMATDTAQGKISNLTFIDSTHVTVVWVKEQEKSCRNDNQLYL